MPEPSVNLSTLLAGAIVRLEVNGKLRAMNTVHLVIPDLFLPQDIAAEVTAGLLLPALERLLVRGKVTSRRHEDLSLEAFLCSLFSASDVVGAPVAEISAMFDGLAEGCWVRADPAYMQLQRTQLVMQPVNAVESEEAAQLCAALNEHFSGQGMEFVAPHPQRWYVRLSAMPAVRTVPLSQACGRDVRGVLPDGEEGARWQQLFNEIQMLLFSHPVNEARAVRGALPVNSLWLWGNGNFEPQARYAGVSSDEVLGEMLAAAIGTKFSLWGGKLVLAQDDQLLVWTGLRAALQRGDLESWRAALQNFETGYVQPLWQALRAGDIEKLQVDVLSEREVRSICLKRTDAWAFWRRPRRLATCSMV